MNESPVRRHKMLCALNRLIKTMYDLAIAADTLVSEGVYRPDYHACTA